MKPDIVYVSISCFGQWGPLSYKIGYDTDAQAMGGIMSITGQADGPPTKTGHASIDYLTGVKAAQAALAALVRRLRTGRGNVDVAMVDCALSVTEGGVMQAANVEQSGNAMAIVTLRPLPAIVFFARMDM